MNRDNLLKVYRVKNLSVWPYEEAIEVRIVEGGQKIELYSDHQTAGSRIYLRHPECYVEWALMVSDDFYGDVDYTATAAHELKDASADEVWLHTEFSLLSSQQVRDNRRLDSLRTKLKADGISALNIPAELQVDTFAIGSGSGSNPLSEKQIEGTFKKSPINQLLLSDASGADELPVISGHTIPTEFAENFQFVWASIVQFQNISAIPTHDDLLSRLALHANWFAKLVPDAS